MLYIFCLGSKFDWNLETQVNYLSVFCVGRFGFYCWREQHQPPRTLHYYCRDDCPSCVCVSAKEREGENEEPKLSDRQYVVPVLGTKKTSRFFVNPPLSLSLTQRENTGNTYTTATTTPIFPVKWGRERKIKREWNHLKHQREHNTFIYLTSLYCVAPPQTQHSSTQRCLTSTDTNSTICSTIG